MARILTCDMVKGCPAPVTHIDRDGYVYCTQHGQTRRQYKACRALRPHELRRLGRGETVTKY